MNALLFCAISAGLMASTLPAHPANGERPGSDLMMTAGTPAPPEHLRMVEFTPGGRDVEAVPARASLTASEQAAADDAEFERLMEAAPDVGTFGYSVIVDPETGAETKVSGFGFADQ